jgi:hypothetical protein
MSIGTAKREQSKIDNDATALLLHLLLKEEGMKGW